MSHEMMDDYTRRVYLARVRDFTDGAPFPSTGDEIVAYASRNNTPSSIMADLDLLRARRFTSLDELARIKGMKGLVRKLKSHLAVSGDTTLRPAGIDPPAAQGVEPGTTKKSAAVAPPEGGLEGSRSNAGAVPPL